MPQIHAGNSIPDTFKSVYRPLYDTHALAAAAIGTSKLFFNHTASSDGINITNLQKAGELAAGERFDMFALRVIPVGFNQVDLEGIMKNYAVRMYVNNSLQLEGPVEYFAAGAGISGAAATTVAATTIQTCNNGAPDPRATAQMPPNHIVQIPAAVPFKVLLEGTSYTITSAAYLRVVLEGIYHETVE